MELRKTKKIIMVLLLLLLLFAATGCADKFENVIFDAYDLSNIAGELKAATGGRYLYPEKLPEGFAPDLRNIEGMFYARTNTWEYSIDLRNTLFTWSYERTKPIPHELPEPGNPVVTQIAILSFEPEHKVDNLQKPNRRIETNAYNRFVEEANSTWEIDGVIVPHGSVFAEVPVSGNQNGSADAEYTGYTLVNVYAPFMHNGVLYTVDMRMNGHSSETEEMMLATGGNMMESFIAAMIRGDN